MPLPTPNLDDRDFNQLLADARQVVTQTCPSWTDLSPSDPGWTLLELFAYLTETLIYRLNQVPDKAYIEFLRLIGVTLYPPSAARVTLRFTRSRASNQPIPIPRGTQVTMQRGSGDQDAPVFVTAKRVILEAGQTEAQVTAFHCYWVAAERAGVASGQPGLTLQTRQRPLIAPTGDGLDLVVGVEARPEELDDRVPAIQYGDKTFRIWQEVEHFVDLENQPLVYTVDRMTGTITFAPSAYLSVDGQLSETMRSPAAIPLRQREIRLWYRWGGGPAGNIAAHSLTVLKDPIPGLQVTNDTPATGGQAAETLENALIRGPLELRSLERAVTASDFELLACRSAGAVKRAKAFTRAQFWRYATPGTVEVLIVPNLPDTPTEASIATIEQFHQQETPDVLNHVQQVLDERRPLGTTCLVRWGQYKPVTVMARVTVHQGEDPQSVRDRLLQRLYRAIHPHQWQFGQPLRVDRVYEMMLAEPGVSHAEQVRFWLEDVPDQDVVSLAVDPLQPQTWYGVADSTLFRSLNDGDSWEPIYRFPQERPQKVHPHPQKPGLLAVTTDSHDPQQRSHVYLSFDCGETWQQSARFSFEVTDLAWITRAGGHPILMLATTAGLYALAVTSGAQPVKLLVDPTDQNLGFYAVAAASDIRDTLMVAVAAQHERGIYLSQEEGKSGSFTLLGLQDEDVRVLAIQADGPRLFLWAGTYVAGNEVGNGCFQRELTSSAGGWQAFQENWSGGSCRALAFTGSHVFACSYYAGVLQLDASRSDAQWHASTVRSGLPVRDTERIFAPITTVAVKGDATEHVMLMVGSAQGVYRSTDGGQTYQNSSQHECSERVPLPPNWLFCSNQHEIEVVSP